MHCIFCYLIEEGIDKVTYSWKYKVVIVSNDF